MFSPISPSSYIKFYGKAHGSQRCFLLGGNRLISKLDKAGQINDQKVDSSN